jgi:GDP-D-mannose 3', 5'-epimerase
MQTRSKILVAGAGGFIGHHLVNFLKEKGRWVRGVDIKLPEFSATQADEFHRSDLREFGNCMAACEGMDEVYQLAADMGGIGFISASHAKVLRNNTLINFHMLEAAKEQKVEKFLYSSSACIYPQYLQAVPDVTPLKESDCYPADAEPGYGWEKLISELANQYYREDYGLKTHVVRFHNIFGPLGTYDGGREKAPAALCRKIALAKNKDIVEIWGDGEQTRSFCYVADCVEGLYRIMNSEFYEPINLGQDRMVTINELVDIITRISGKTLAKRHNLESPQGVRGRNCDNSKIRAVLQWTPRVSLEDGLAVTYRWIREELSRKNLSEDYKEA